MDTIDERILGQNKRVKSNLTDEEKKAIEELMEDAISKTIEQEELKEVGEKNILMYLHEIDKNILKHRKEDFEANKKFGGELRDIHRMLNRGVIFILIIVLFCGISIGGIITAYSDTLLPMLGYILDTAKIANALSK